MRTVFKYNVKDYDWISSMDDFYSGVPGLKSVFDKYEIKPYRAFINRKSCERLLDYMLSRVPLRSVDRFRWEVICSHDWLTNAPNVSLDIVPVDEIWVDIDIDEVKQ